MKVPPELVNKIMAQKSLIYFVLKWERAFKSQSHLLFLQVCDLQAKVKRLNTENQDLTSQLRVYKETQVTFRSKLARSFYLRRFFSYKNSSQYFEVLVLLLFTPSFIIYII